MTTVRLYHWCRLCDRDTGRPSEIYCDGCVGDMDADADPIRWPATPPRPGRWARVWAWLETRPDWIADLGSED